MAINHEFEQRTFGAPLTDAEYAAVAEGQDVLDSSIAEISSVLGAMIVRLESAREQVQELRHPVGAQLDRLMQGISELSGIAQGIASQGHQSRGATEAIRQKHIGEYRTDGTWGLWRDLEQSRSSDPTAESRQGKGVGVPRGSYGGRRRDRRRYRYR